MKKTLRLITFLAPAAFLVAPFFASAASTYASCTTSSDCTSPGEMCIYTSDQNTPSHGRCGCMLPQDSPFNNASLCSNSPVTSVTPTVSGPSGINEQYLQGYKTSIIGIINNLVAPVLLAIAFIFFLFGVYRYFILGATNDTERATGRQFILWGIIGFVVIFSLWGLVAIVRSTFGLTAGGGAPPYPTL